MNRTYVDIAGDTVHSNSARFFLGTEVERTPMYQQDTLFVVGIQPVEEIVTLAKEWRTKHIYFGANMSFKISYANSSNIKPILWERMIQQVLDQGFWCTLDFDITESVLIKNMSFALDEKFIPMISVKNRHWSTWENPNATIKLDDVGFKEYTPGVWCWPANQLLTDDRLTKWSDYGQDMLLEMEKPNNVVKLPKAKKSKRQTSYDYLPSDSEPK